MFTPLLYKTIRAVLHLDLDPVIYSELATPAGSANFNGSHQDFIDRTQQIFVERGYQKVTSESTVDQEILLFVKNKALHLVFCLPGETYVTTIEIQACWEAQLQVGAQSSSVAAPHRFSKAAKEKAAKLGVEPLEV